MWFSGNLDQRCPDCKTLKIVNPDGTTTTIRKPPEWHLPKEGQINPDNTEIWLNGRWIPMLKKEYDDDLIYEGRGPWARRPAALENELRETKERLKLLLEVSARRYKTICKLQSQLDAVILAANGTNTKELK